MNTQEALDRFQNGFKRFRQTWYLPSSSVYEQLKDGQHPWAVVICCSDSRVDPVQILNAAPGELFVVRNVGNLAPAFEEGSFHHSVSAAVEYAVRHLKVSHAIIMGHRRCGGIADMVGGPHPGDELINCWTAQARSARAAVERALPGAQGDEVLHACEEWGVRLGLKNLSGYPSVREAVDKGALQLHGLYFDMVEGSLFRLDPGSDTFLKLA